MEAILPIRVEPRPDPIAREFQESALAQEVFEKYLQLETGCAAGSKQW
jgi:hypothetical protein